MWYDAPPWGMLGHVHVALEFTPDRRAPARAREMLGVLASSVVPEVLEDLRLVVSELVANSVKFGPGESIRVELDVDAPGLVRGEVVDQGEGDVVHVRPEPGVDGGFGLWLVDRLAVRWGVAEGSTHVWFVLGDEQQPG